MAPRSARLLLASCVALALLLVLVDVRGPAPAESLRGAVGAVAGPPERALTWLRTQVGSRIGGSTQERARIAQLEQELAQARSAAGEVAAGGLDRLSMAELVAVAPAQGFVPVPGRVLALSTPQDQVRSATLSVGSGSRVSVGQAVIAAGGLAGLVDSVAPGVSTMRLVVDPGLAIAARVTPSGEAGVYRGTGRSGSFELLDPLGRMSAGDLVVTLGTPEGDLAPGLAIGRISAISGSAADLTRVAEVAPAADDSTLDRVAVLVPGAGS